MSTSPVLYTTIISATILLHVSAVDFCNEISPILPSECSCSSQQYGATVGCAVNFFDVDTIGLTGEFELCHNPASATIKVNDTKFGINHELAGLVAGKAIDFPIPGLSLDIPDIGSVGVNAVFDIEGDLENMDIKLGLDACGKVLGHSVCGSKLTDELPIYILDHTFNFDSLCKQAIQEAAAVAEVAVAGPFGASNTTALAAPSNFLLDFNTDIDGIGVITINVTRSWAPIGVDHLYSLVMDQFFDGAAFFRVDGGFVLQFGIAGTPAENVKWQKPIMDDPVGGPGNIKYTVSYAATSDKNSRTTQLFFNYKNNSGLDSQGFAPVGIAIEGTQYLDRVHDPTPGNPNGVDQNDYETKGNAWIRSQYPEINFIKKATIRK